jgi:glucan 1,3-beta-glucosidase
LGPWGGFLPGADRIALDYHPYLAFQAQPTDTIQDHVTEPCDTWGGQLNKSMAAFGLTAAGEFSNGITDCGTFLNGVGQGSRYEGDYIYDLTGQFPRIGSCDPFIQWQTWDDSTKAAMKQFAMSSMDALGVCCFFFNQ